MRIAANLWVGKSEMLQIPPSIWDAHSNMGMDQYLLIPFLVGWTSIYQLFWCSPGVQGFDTLPYGYGTRNVVLIPSLFYGNMLFLISTLVHHRSKNGLFTIGCENAEGCWALGHRQLWCSLDRTRPWFLPLEVTFGRAVWWLTTSQLRVAQRHAA